MEWFIKALKKYAVFSGRARRKEYWMFVLFGMIVSVLLEIPILILMVISGASEQSIQNFGNIFALVVSFSIIIPSFALTVRRLHDTNHSAWWLFVPVYNFILIGFIEGTKGDNHYGSDPKTS